MAEDAQNPVSVEINANDSVIITGENNDQSNIKLGVSTAQVAGQPTGNISITAQGNIIIDGVINTTGISQLPPSFASDAGDIFISSVNGDVTVSSIASYGTVSSGIVEIEGDILDLGFIISNRPNISEQPFPETLGGEITVDGVSIIIGGEVTGESLTVNGDLTLSENINPLIIQGQSFFGDSIITTTTDQRYNNNVTIGDNVTMTATNGNINIIGDINSETGETNNLTVTGNNVTFSQAVGNDQALGDIRLNSSGITSMSTLNANSLNTNEGGETRLSGNITTTTNQVYNDSLILITDTQLTGNSIIFNSSIDSQTTPQSLTVNANENINYGDGIGDDRIGATVGLSELDSNASTISLNINLLELPEDAVSVNTTGNQIFSPSENEEEITTLSVNLNSDAILQGNNITFNGSIDGSQSFTVNNIGEGEATFNGDVGSVTPLTDLTTNTEGKTILNGNVTTTNNQTYNNPLVLARDTQLTGNSIIFNSSIDSQTTPQSLTVNANENINYGDGIGDDRIGATVGLNNLSTEALDIFINIDRAGLSPTQASINTIGNQSYTIINSEIGETIYLAKDSIFNTKDFTVEGNIKVDPSVINGVSLTINATGDVSIDGEENNEENIAVAIDTALGNRGGDVVIDADGNIVITEIVGTGRLSNNTFVTNAGDVTLNSDGNIAVGAIGTTGNETSGKVEISGENLVMGTILTQFEPLVSGVGGTVEISALNTLLLGEISAEAVTVNGNLLMTNFTSLGVSIPPNLPTIANSKITTTQDQTYNGNIFLDDTSTFIGRGITFNGEIDSFNLDKNIVNLPELEIIDTVINNITDRANATPHNLMVEGSQNIQLGNGVGDDRIGSVAGLASLTTTGATNININTPADSISVNTTGNQTYKDDLTISSDATLTSSQGSLNFNGEVNASNNLTLISLTGINFADSQNVIGSNGDLTLQTIGNSTINIGNIANQFSLTNLDQINGFANIQIGGDNTPTINVNEILTLNDPLTLTANNINVNQQIRGNDNASITINGAGTTTILNADITTQGNPITIDDNVILGNDITLSTNSGDGSANLDILGTIDGNHDLTLNGSNILIEGAIGSSLSLNNLTISSNNTEFNGDSITTTGNQTFNTNLTLSQNTNFIVGSVFQGQNIASDNTNVIINAQAISTGDIVTEGGDIALTSTQNGITTGNLNSSADAGGTINIDSATTVTTQAINTQGSNSRGDNSDGGDFTIKAKEDIEITTIDTRSQNNTGGDVSISTTGKIRVTETLENGFSIDSSGAEGGTVIIDLFPNGVPKNATSDPRLPFIVGDASNNGTAGLISNENFTIVEGEYNFNTQEGNLRLNLLPSQPEPPPPNNNRIDGRKIDERNYDNPGDVITPGEGLSGDSPTSVVINNPPIPIARIDQAQEILTTIEREAAAKPALIYVSFTPRGFQPQDLDAEFARREVTNTQEYSRVNVNKSNLKPTVNLPSAEDDQLDILIVTQDEKPLRIVIPVTRKQVVETAGNLWAKTSDVFALDDSYKPYASDMYNWLIKPIEKELEAREISNLLFILPTDMRFIPLAALYDAENQQFLVEKYSSGLAPSLNLNDNRYRPLKDAGLLAMGASEFADSGIVPLPAAGLELPSISKVWTGERPDNYQEYLNENFTLEQVKANLSRQAFGIVHFGTHGDFNPTDTNESFLQLYDSRLNITELRRLGLNDPLVELMVLSACETAFGNEIAELGFAGLAVQAGVKSAMGSVWQVSDTGTLALMTDFYAKLKDSNTKSEALRQAQLDMLKGRVYKTSDGNAIVTPNLEISLESLPDTSRFPEDFSHPFYWSPFTMIGNPW